MSLRIVTALLVTCLSFLLVSELYLFFVCFFLRSRLRQHARRLLDLSRAIGLTAPATITHCAGGEISRHACASKLYTAAAVRAAGGAAPRRGDYMRCTRTLLLRPQVFFVLFCLFVVCLSVCWRY